MSEHIVYRCYDADDRLIYVGCTSDVVSRMQVHGSSWGNPVSAALNMRMVRHTETAYPDKVSGRRAEREAIFAEAPVLNLHHQRVRLTPAARRVLIEEYLQATRPEPDPKVAAAWAELAGRFARAG